METKIEVKQAAMWIKKTKTGNDYHSVKIELADGQSFWVNLFQSGKKDKPTQPDFKTINEKKNEEPPADGLPF